MDKFRDVNQRTRIEQALFGTMSDGRQWKEKASGQICDLELLVVEAVEAVKILSDKVGRAEPWLALNVGGHGSRTSS